jgi:hypothetical protein
MEIISLSGKRMALVMNFVGLSLPVLRKYSESFNTGLTQSLEFISKRLLK